MKSKTNSKKESRMTWAPNLTIKSLVISALVLTGIQAPLQAQEIQYAKPSWYFGVAAGSNFNFFRGSTHQLNAEFTPPATFHNGNQGVGFYGAPLIEYRPANSVWGVMLQAGYDSRRGEFIEETTACNCPADLKTNLSYITIEPSLRIAPFKSGFYLYGGPRLAFNLDKEFTYQLGTNPNFPNQEPSPDVRGEFSDVKETIISMQIGAGYDIPISSKLKQTQFVLSPFIAFHPYFGQNPRSTETWNITTVRAGFALKFGRGSRIEVAGSTNAQSQFSVNSPTNIPNDRRVSEIFPLRNYIFFDEGSNAIPTRYELLRKDQVKDFKEDQLKVSSPENLSGRSKRQMIVYYNVLNILGDRMQKNPSATITLVGSSQKGPEDGRAMAQSIKTYLVDVFAITASRIAIEGRTKPSIPSEQPGGTQDLELLRQGDRRVSIESNSPDLLMEFQSGPNAPLKPVVISAPQVAPVESYVTFNNVGAKQAFTSWKLELKDEKGKVQTFGPYTEDSISIPGNLILGSRPHGDYMAKMIGTAKDGTLSEKEAPMHVTLWTPAKVEEGIRYTIIYEFNESKAISIYEKYLTEIVTPKIPVGATVIIKGHTDIIGDEAHNQDLSLARANDVKTIIESALSKTGRTDVKFQINGFGENQNSAPFANKFPEERFYNRTVIIDIIPTK
ncbi:outer membrane beta-barrel protein [Flavobacterium sp.]|uniref:outer membrane beta-barrel protein n=1 Tax=Flavobacterium sp. TaxID=239 RepID=UPI002B4AB20B|nr:outer membrane beta-barrel protein [Flavobacterium sp.]HLF52383.1 outer membrane beta-barrel protein [Flavobacterium sp.]